MLSIVSIGDMSRKKHEQDLREKLDKSGVTQRHCRMGPLIDLQANGDFLHLPSQDQDHVYCEVAAEGGETPYGVRVVLFHLWPEKSLRSTMSSNAYLREQRQFRTVRGCCRRILDTASCGAPAENARRETSSAIPCSRLP